MRAILFLLFLIAGCGGTPPDADEVERQAFDDLREEIRLTIDDADRGLTLLNTATGGAGSGVFETDTGTTLTVANIIDGQAGDNGFTKTGGGTLALNGAHTYSGDTVISQGTLALGRGMGSGLFFMVVSPGAT